jgi:hypothetical protein
VRHGLNSPEGTSLACGPSTGACRGRTRAAVVRHGRVLRGHGTVVGMTSGPPLSAVAARAETGKRAGG